MAKGRLGDIAKATALAPLNTPSPSNHLPLAASLLTPANINAATKAKMQGYEGDPCGECGNYTLVRNGTCMKCNTCGRLLRKVRYCIPL